METSSGIPQVSFVNGIYTKRRIHVDLLQGIIQDFMFKIIKIKGYSKGYKTILQCLLIECC